MRVCVCVCVWVEISVKKGVETGVCVCVCLWGGGVGMVGSYYDLYP